MLFCQELFLCIKNAAIFRRISRLNCSVPCSGLGLVDLFLPGKVGKPTEVHGCNRAPLTRQLFAGYELDLIGVVIPAVSRRKLLLPMSAEGILLLVAMKRPNKHPAIITAPINRDNLKVHSVSYLGNYGPKEKKYLPNPINYSISHIIQIVNSMPYSPI